MKNEIRIAIKIGIKAESLSEVLAFHFSFDLFGTGEWFVHAFNIRNL